MKKSKTIKIIKRVGLRYALAYRIRKKKKRIAKKIKVTHWYKILKMFILVNKAKALKDKIPEKVYMALMNTDVKAINTKYYLADASEV